MVEETSYPDDYISLTKPIVKTWNGLLGRARESKKEFTDLADQVMSFYSGGPGAMWKPDYMNRYMGGTQAITPPRFKITSNIAFEQVAVMGPLLFWEMTDRSVKPHRRVQLDPQALAGGNEQAMAYFEQLAQQQTNEDVRSEMRAKILEHMLNYFQREQPWGLSAHSDLAIFEALTKGAGFLKTDDYKFPASDRTLVGSFFTSVDDVLVDADCTDPLWTTADWIAIRHRTKIEATEQHFGLKRGSLKDYASMASQGAAHQVNVEKDANITVPKDLVEWYEIYSRAGFGNKLTGRRENPLPIDPAFDSARGDDFVYLCICPTCPWPLNLPSPEFAKPYATDEWIKHQTDWPTEYWRDNKWPIEMLSFYPHSGKSPWPQAPLAAALGELTCLNILMSAYIQEAFEGRQTIIGVKKGAIEQLNSIRTSDQSPLIVEIDPSFKETISQCIEFLKRPEVNGDLPQSIEFVIGLIEKRTGLRDEMYGGNSGANPRSATEFQGKMDTVNIRPEHMQKKVAAWQSRVADKEVFCLYIHVGSQDIAEQLGPLGMAAWDELVTHESPEVILRSSKVIVEASGIRRPNKAKDMADLQAMMQYLMPILAGQMAQTGDVGPINGFIRAVGDAGEIDVSEFLFPEPQPNALGEQQQQAELAKSQAQADKFSADAEKARADAQATLNQGQQAQQDAQVKMAVAEHGMDLKERQHQMAAAAKQQDMENKQGMHEQGMAHRAQQARQDLALKLMQNAQSMNQSTQSHLHQTSIADDKAQSDAQRGNLITYQKMLMSNAQHQQRLQQQNQLGAQT